MFQLLEEQRARDRITALVLHHARGFVHTLSQHQSQHLFSSLVPFHQKAVSKSNADQLIFASSVYARCMAIPGSALSLECISINSAF